MTPGHYWPKNNDLFEVILAKTVPVVSNWSQGLYGVLCRLIGRILRVPKKPRIEQTGTESACILYTLAQ